MIRVIRRPSSGIEAMGGSVVPCRLSQLAAMKGAICRLPGIMRLGVLSRQPLYSLSLLFFDMYLFESFFFSEVIS